MLRRIAPLMAVAALAVIVPVVLAATPARVLPTQRIDVKVLLVSADGTEPGFGAWKAELQREGVPYSTLVAYSGQATLGLGDPFLFQSIAAAVIGGVAILGGRGHYLGTVAGAISLVALISLLQAENMPEYGRSIVYGGAILVVLILFGREERT